jgi:rifampicin phosphotransferase
VNVLPISQPVGWENSGGKARALAELWRAGFDVPPFLLLLPEASEADWQAHQDTIAGWPSVAVRSSAQGEDGDEHSFAGQLESYLELRPDQVWAHVLAVRASGHAERVIAYRRERGLEGPPPVPAVLVQKMVNARAAGVAFSANPVDGRRGTRVVAAVRGLGVKLVDGSEDAETWRIGRDGKTLSIDRLSESVLNEAEAIAVAQLASAAEAHFGRPQDIEWAIEGKQLYLLQSRPITSLHNLPDPDGVAQIWDNSNISESYPGISSPLTFSFARRCYQDVYVHFCRLMGVEDDVLADNAALFRMMLGSIRGRIYYNLLNWYRVLALLPGFQVNRPFMEQMMGVKEGLPPAIAASLTQNEGGVWQARWRFSRSLFGIAWNAWTIESEIAKFHARLESTLNEVPASIASLRLDELAAAYRRMESRLITHWKAPLVNDFFAMIAHGLLQKLSAKWLGENGSSIANDLLIGQGGMISAEPAQRLMQMAAELRLHPELIPLLTQGGPRDLEAAWDKAPQLGQLFKSYIQRFGDRCLEELKLESIALEEDPLPLARSIAGLALLPSSPIQNERPQPNLALGGNPLRRAVFHLILHWARKRVQGRENLRFERTRVFGRVRRLTAEMGKRLLALGVLREARDVYYLEVEEVLGFVEGTVPAAQLGVIAAARKAEYADYHATPAPASRFETLGAVHQGNRFTPSQSTTAASGDTRQGLAACPGLVRAKARVIRDPKGATLERGEILVAERTDPGWILLFPLAAGVLVERGSLLSHSAIVSRELGIPAVVQIDGLTAWLKTGDLVEMDGATGRVTLVQ